MRLFPGILLLIPALVAAEPLTQGHRDRAMSELQATRKAFLDAVAGLTPEQWNYKPDAARWSVAECAEHIAASEDLLFQMLAKKIMRTPAQPEKRAEVKGQDELILKQMSDRSRKAKAPQELQPSNRFGGPQGAVDHFKQARDATIQYVETTSDALRDHFITGPDKKVVDGYQWLLGIAGHTDRHVAQISEIKASPGFPRR